MSLPNPRKTALNASHRQLGVCMREFADWGMPVQQACPIPEHLAVRKKAGIFGVSRMGEIELVGSTAKETVRRLAPKDVGSLADVMIREQAVKVWVLPTPVN